MTNEEFISKSKELASEFLSLVTEFNTQATGNGSGELFGDYVCTEDPHNQSPIVIASINCSLQGEKMTTLENAVLPATCSFSLGCAKAAHKITGTTTASSTRHADSTSKQVLNAMFSEWDVSIV